MRNILSIDGGGIKGLIPAILLTEIERGVGRPLHEVFDLVVGTSTGAALAGAIAMPIGMDMKKAQDLYRLEGPRIFRKARSRFTQLFKPKYRGSNLYDVLKKYFGDVRLASAQTMMMTTAYDVSGRWDEAEEPGPVLFKSWRESVAEVKAVDAIQASAAAPSYFPPHRVDVPWKPGTRACLYDGGLFAGNPALCAYGEGLRLFPGEDLFICSLGTGEHEASTPCRHADGLINVATKVTGWMLDGSADSVDYIVDKIIPSEIYVRFNHTLTRAVKMDDASEKTLTLLDKIARTFITENPERIQGVIDRLKAT